jgi:hypothetical protein
MSETIFRLLLRMFPRRFRTRYEEEAMLLYRDRARDERGLVARARLWWDLAMDLAFSLPVLCRRTEPVLASAQRQLNGPVFWVLEPDVPSPSAIFYGGMVSLLVFGSMFVWIGHGRNHRLQQEWMGPPEPSTTRVAAGAGLPIAGEPAALRSGGRTAVAGSGPGSLDAAASFDKWNDQPSPARLPSAQNVSPIAVRMPHIEGAVQPAGFERRIDQPSYTALRGAQSASPVAAGEPHVEDATKAMVEAIEAHQIVMFGETHANKQEYEWLCSLVKTPRFADQVDDIVIEFGNSLYQKTADRYIAGEDVPPQQVEKAWRNVVGAVGPVSPVYGRFYRAVRESNIARPGGHRIRLLLGDPYAEWDKIKDAEDLGPYLAHRDEWYAQVVKDEVLARHHRALLIMGAGHFLRRNGPGFVEREVRAAGVNPYLVVFGTDAVGGYDDLDRRFDLWPVPAIAGLSGNWVGELPAMPVVTGGMVAPNSLRMAQVADALFYAGHRDAQIQVNMPRAELDGTAYGTEVNRRLLIQTGRTTPFDAQPEEPQFRRPIEQTVSNGIHRLPPSPPKSAGDPLPPRPPSQ